MAEARFKRTKTADSRPAEARVPSAGLVPAHPLPARVALLQIALLAGCPLLLLFLARYLLRHFFPDLGY